MFFALGFILGVVFSLFLITTLAFFRVGIERRIQMIQQKVESAGPKPQGFIVEPEDETELARRRIIAENDRKGRPTKLSELS